MERIEEIPGLSSDCKDCKYRKEDDYPYLEYPCKIAGSGDAGNLVFPKIIIDSGSYTCNSYGPNLVASLRNWVRRAAPFFRAIQSSLPQ